MLKKVVLLVLGLLSLMLGLALGVAGAGLLAVSGRSGTIESGYHQVATDGTAVISDPVAIGETSNVNVNGADATVTLQARNAARPVFLGIGRAEDVEAYLAGSSYDVVTDLQFGANYRMGTRTMPGAGSLSSPAEQSFWVAQASGDAPTLDWKIDDGSYRAVVMNADGSQGVRADLRMGVRVPALFGVSMCTLVSGILLGLLGLGLIIWGIRAKRTPPTPSVYSGNPLAPIPVGQPGYPGTPAQPLPGQPVPPPAFTGVPVDPTSPPPAQPWAPPGYPPPPTTAFPAAVPPAVIPPAHATAPPAAVPPAAAATAAAATAAAATAAAATAAAATADVQPAAVQPTDVQPTDVQPADAQPTTVPPVAPPAAPQPVAPPAAAQPVAPPPTVPIPAGVPITPPQLPEPQATAPAQAAAPAQATAPAAVHMPPMGEPTAAPHGEAGSTVGGAVETGDGLVTPPVPAIGSEGMSPQWTPHGSPDGDMRPGA